MWHGAVSRTVLKIYFTKESTDWNYQCSRITDEKLTQSAHLNVYGSWRTWTKSMGSTICTETGYGLDNWGVRVWIPVRSRIDFSLSHLDWLWGPTSLLSNRYQWLFPLGKVARAWSWQLISKVKITWVYIQLPNKSSWCSAELVKHRYNFTF
jgi:hypothetical protein